MAKLFLLWWQICSLSLRLLTLNIAVGQMNQDQLQFSLQTSSSSKMKSLENSLISSTPKPSLSFLAFLMPVFESSFFYPRLFYDIWKARTFFSLLSQFLFSFKTTSPIHCLTKDIAGDWVLYVGPNMLDKNTDHVFSDLKETFKTTSTICGNWNCQIKFLIRTRKSWVIGPMAWFCFRSPCMSIQETKHRKMRMMNKAREMLIYEMRPFWGCFMILRLLITGDVSRGWDDVRGVIQEGTIFFWDIYW